MTKAMRSLTDKAPTLSQKSGIIENWFKSKADNHGSAISVRQAGEVILEKNLISDIDSAIKIVVSQLKLDKDVNTSLPLTLDEF